MNLDKKKLIKLLNIDKPFLLIDKLTKVIPSKSATGIKSYNQKDFFTNHILLISL